jgi:hypothetical protein
MLLHSCYCAHVIALMLLRSCYCAHVITLMLLRSCYCAHVITLMLLLSCYCSHVYYSYFCLVIAQLVVTILVAQSSPVILLSLERDIVILFLFPVAERSYWHCNSKTREPYRNPHNIFIWGPSLLLKQIYMVLLVAKEAIQRIRLFG